MRKFTVILLYPDYLAENFGQEIYTAHVEAVSPADAVQKAREKAATDEWDDEVASDFYPLFVAYGFLDNVNP